MKKLFIFLILLAGIASVYALQVGDPTYLPRATTWAAKPTCNAGATNTQILVTDVGANSDSLFICDGTRWNAAAPVTLCNGNTQVADSDAGAGDTDEDVYATCTIKGGLMGSNSFIFVEETWAITNSANTKTGRVRFNGAAGTAYWQLAMTSQLTYRPYTLISNRNATNSQISLGYSTVGVGGGGVAAVTSAVDTTADVDVVLSCQKATGTESCTLEQYRVLLYP